MPSEALPHGRANYLPPSQGDKTIGAQIADITFEHPSRSRWLVAFGMFPDGLMAGHRAGLAVLLGHRCLGQQHPGRLGIGHRQL